jgi:hypothetical protein
MSEAAKIVIDAEDLASKKFYDAAKNAERNIKAVKDVGKSAKASTDFFGSLANSLGGNQLGAYASELSNLTSKVSSFSEVSKAGGAGALAFKAGLIGVAATLSFKVGQALGDVIFQTKEWTKELAKATEEAQKLSQAVLRAAGNSFQAQVQQIDFIEDPEVKKKATEELIRQLDQDIEAKNKQIAQYRKQVSDVDETWSGFFSKVSGDVRAINEQNKAQAEEAQKLKEIYKEQALELRKKLVADEEALKLEEKKRAEAEAIKRQLEEQKKAAEEEKRIAAEKKRAADEELAAAKRIEDIRQREILRLKEQRILLTEGAEAAKRFSLEQQGIDAESARRIAASEAELKKMQEKDTSFSGTVGVGQQAVQSRLLTRGPAERGIDKIEKNTKDALGRFDNMIRELARIKLPKPEEIVG